MDRLFYFLVWAQSNMPSGGGGGSSGGAPSGGGAPPSGGGGGEAPPAGGGGAFPMNLILIGGMIVLFWFLLIRPQQKRAKQHQEMVKSLQAGDRVITNSGMFGEIIQVDERTVTLEIAKGTRVRMLKNHVGGRADEQTEKQLAQAPQQG